MAETLNLIGSQGLQDAILKERMEPYQAPENMPCLADIPVNSELWRTLQTNTRGTDAALQQIHKIQAKGLIPLVCLADKLTRHVEQGEEAPSPKEAQNSIVSGIALLLAANHQLHRERRRLIQPELKDHYRDLSKRDNPIVGNLFGPDLAKQVKELDESQKMTTTLTKPQPGSSKQNFNIGSYRGKQKNIFQKGQRGRFLGQRQYGQNNKPRQQNNQNNQRGKPRGGQFRQQNNRYQSNSQRR